MQNCEATLRMQHCASFLLCLLLFLSGCVEAVPVAPQPKARNNFVTELLEVAVGKKAPAEGYAFLNPRKGWVFFRIQTAALKQGSVELYLDGSAPENLIIQQDSATQRATEAMRYLPAGEHRLVVKTSKAARLSSLTVRAIPVILYANYQATTQVKEYGTYDWDFLKRIGMLDNVNVLIVGAGQGNDSNIKEWLRQGKQAIQQVSVPGLGGDGELTEDKAYEYWSKSDGMTSPGLSGVIADEFYPSLSGKFPLWLPAIQRVVSEHKDRVFYPYVAGDPQGLIPLVKPLFENGCCFAYERYLKEQRTETAARQHIEKMLKDEVMVQFSRGAPGIEKATIFVLGILCGPPETLNANPGANFKVYMDMQFHLLATDPAFNGLYGLEEYLSSYADEEYLRWAAKLYRHYCIEGNTNRLTNDPYELSHIQNPDFESGLNGWDVSPAEKGTVDVRVKKGLGWLEGRYPPDAEGDTFLWTMRSAQRPNVIAQEIKQLQPGRAYSLKLYSGDCRELTREGKLAISVKIEDVEFIADKCFQTTFKSCYDHHTAEYPDKAVCFNFVRLVFRPRSATAMLTISDWLTDKEPGGPIGQELLYNFVEIEPYLMD